MNTTEHDSDDVESEESNGRHDETTCPSIRMVVRKMECKIKKVNVSEADTIEDIDTMIENQNKIVKTCWTLTRRKVDASKKIGSEKR